MAATAAAPARPRSGVRRLPPNVFAIAFGFLGLAIVWRTAARELGAPSGFADAAALAGIGAWAAALPGFLAGGARQAVADARNPALSPFVVLPCVDLLLIGEQLATRSPAVGDALTIAGAVLVVIVGGLLLGAWFDEIRDPDRLHPGYLIPTLAGGYLAAAGVFQAGAPGLAKMLFGIGTFGWLAIGTPIVGRLLLRPPLAEPLVPTLSILVAPPAVAGTAWLTLNGGEPDAIAFGLAGVSALSVITQLALLPRYLRVPFGLGSWAFSFSWAAVTTFALHWLAIEDPPGRDWFAGALAAAITCGIAALAWKTAVALRRGTLFPGPAPAPASERG